jgi:hypothetical protein
MGQAFVRASQGVEGRFVDRRLPCRSMGFTGIDLKLLLS